MWLSWKYSKSFIYYSQWFVYRMEVFTPIEVLRKVKSITKDSQDGELATRLGVSKQSLSQYKNKNSVDVQLRIIALLIGEIEKKTSNKLLNIDS